MRLRILPNNNDGSQQVSEKSKVRGDTDGEFWFSYGVRRRVRKKICYTVNIRLNSMRDDEKERSVTRNLLNVFWALAFNQVFKRSKNVVNFFDKMSVNYSINGWQRSP